MVAKAKSSSGKPVVAKEKVKSKGKLSIKNIFVLSIFGLLVILFLWKTIQYNRLEKRMTREKEQIINQSLAFTTNQEKTFLLLFSKPFSWAVRTQMLRNNLDEVNDYFNQLIKEDRFEQISLIDNEGVIEVCTNKKIEGESAEAFFGGFSYDAFSTELQNVGGDTILISTPVLGYDKRLGTIVIHYRAGDLQSLIGD